jgi:hypothetical protein
MLNNKIIFKAKTPFTKSMTSLCTSEIQSNI